MLIKLKDIYYKYSSLESGSLFEMGNNFKHRNIKTTIKVDNLVFDNAKPVYTNTTSVKKNDNTTRTWKYAVFLTINKEPIDYVVFQNIVI